MLGALHSAVRVLDRHRGRLSIAWRLQCHSSLEWSIRFWGGYFDRGYDTYDRHHVDWVAGDYEFIGGLFDLFYGDGKDGWSFTKGFGIGGSGAGAAVAGDVETATARGLIFFDRSRGG